MITSKEKKNIFESFFPQTKGCCMKEKQIFDVLKEKNIFGYVSYF